MEKKEVETLKRIAMVKHFKAIFIFFFNNSPEKSTPCTTNSTGTPSPFKLMGEA